MSSKSWRVSDSPLAALDFIGIRSFVYGGNPEWVRRRWFMLMAMIVGFGSAVAACIATSLGVLTEDLAKTVVSNYFSLVMVVVPGYILGAVWDKKNQMDSGATVTEVKETVTDAGPPATSTKTETKQTAPIAQPPVPVDPE